MRGRELEKSLLNSRQDGKTELIFFVNAGDPSLMVTYELLRVLAQHKVATVELCMPFPKSLTDGPLIRESHRRALANGIDFQAVLELIDKARNELGLAIVLLADYGHTVTPLGLERFLKECYSAGVYATLVHCLPPAYRREYVECSAVLGLGRIMSFFVGSNEHLRKAAYQQAEGFIYVVSRFGRTGQKVSFDASMRDRLKNIRSETDKPLAVGFGIKSINDIAVVRSAGMDAAILGSVSTAVVQSHLNKPRLIAGAFDTLLQQMATGSTNSPHANIARR